MPKAAVYLLGLIAGLQLVDPAVANTAIIEAGKALGFTASQRALGASVSTLALAATVLAAGVAADRLGRRRVLICSVLLAVAGDVIVALAPVTEVYLAGRALAGVGLGAALAATFAYVRFVTPASKITAALGLWSAIMIGLLIVASPIGGALAAHSWRVAMLLVPVLGGALVVFVPRLLPVMPRSGDGPVDYAGLVLVGAATVSLLYGLSQAATSLSSPAFYGPVFAGVIGFVLFGIVEVRTTFPAFPIRLFAGGLFVAAVIAGVAWNFAQAVVQLSTSNLWQFTKGSSPLGVTVLQLPMLIVLFAASVAVGSYLDRHGEQLRRILALGFTCCVFGLLLMMLTRQSWPAWVVVPGATVAGVGLALISVPQAAMFVAEAPARDLGAVTSFRTTVGQIGYAAGLALSVVFVQTFGHQRYAEDLQDAGIVTPSQVAAGIDDVRHFAQHQVEPTTALGRAALQAAEKAYTQGFDTTMAVSALVIAVMGVATLLVMNAGKPQGHIPPSKTPPPVNRDQRRESG
ncbi:MAG: MFS transporter [Actinomycetia bacterium]|nr:MFS transporter [Actinomycetes bacterium]MCH9700397.1 MFS transporter [Actinomycetes bacterium]MCH9759687.1 MFS transporter [Actinomycetes bacterium]